MQRTVKSSSMTNVKASHEDGNVLRNMTRGNDFESTTSSTRLSFIVGTETLAEVLHERAHAPCCSITVSVGSIFLVHLRLVSLRGDAAAGLA